MLGWIQAAMQQNTIVQNEWYFLFLCHTLTKLLAQNRRSSLNLLADFLKRAETKGCDHVIVIRPTQDPYPLKIQRLTRPPTIFLVHKLIINGKMQMRFDTPTSSIIQTELCNLKPIQDWTGSPKIFNQLEIIIKLRYDSPTQLSRMYLSMKG